MLRWRWITGFDGNQRSRKHPRGADIERLCVPQGSILATGTRTKQGRDHNGPPSANRSVEIDRAFKTPAWPTYDRCSIRDLHYVLDRRSQRTCIVCDTGGRLGFTAA